MPISFDTDLRIIASDGTTTVHSFGTGVNSVLEPGDATRKQRVAATRVDGDYVTAEADDAGDLVAVVTFEGSTWAAVEAAYQTARTAWRAESVYYLEVEREGVTKRYVCDRPDSVTPDTPDLLNKRQRYSIRWHVQPSPTISYA